MIPMTDLVPLFAFTQHQKKNCGAVGNYKLSEDAQVDLIRIHQHGVREYGEVQADTYYYKLIERFEQLAATLFVSSR